MGVLTSKKEAASSERARIPQAASNRDTLEGGRRDRIFLGFPWFPGCGGGGRDDENGDRVPRRPPGRFLNELPSSRHSSRALHHRNVTERSLGTAHLAPHLRSPHQPQVHVLILLALHLKLREAGSPPEVTQESGLPGRGIAPRPGGFTSSGPPQGGAGSSPPAPAPEGRARGREGSERAGRNVSGRGAAARSGGDSRAGGRAAGAAGPSARDASLHRGAGRRAAARRL